jgi:hypothetical protein
MLIDAIRIWDAKMKCCQRVTRIYFFWQVIPDETQSQQVKKLGGLLKKAGITAWKSTGSDIFQNWWLDNWQCSQMFQGGEEQAKEALRKSEQWPCTRILVSIHICCLLGMLCLSWELIALHCTVVDLTACWVLWYFWCSLCDGDRRSI